MAEQIVAQCTSFSIGTVLSIFQWIRILHVSSFHLHSTGGSNSLYSLSYTRSKFLCKMCVCCGTQYRCGHIFMLWRFHRIEQFLQSYVLTDICFVKTLHDTVYVSFTCIATIVYKSFPTFIRFASAHLIAYIWRLCSVAFMNG